VIEGRLAERIGEKVNYDIEGMPRDFESAVKLAERDKYQFQWWANYLFNPHALREQKKGADRFGQHRNPASRPWRPDAFVGHSYDIYDNGTLSTVQYDDTGGDQDFNDFILEVAVVKRDRPDIIFATEGQVEVFARFERDALPRLRKERTGA
jgi:hypothetical protein